MIDTTRSSFIPKETPGMVPGRVKRRRTFHVFGFLATALLIGSLVLAGLVILLKNNAQKNLDAAKLSLTNESAQFKDEYITEVRNFDRKLKAAELLMNDHVSFLKVLAALERNTKSNVQLVDFDFTYDPGFQILATIGGVTREFTTLALQEQQFDQDLVLSDVLFKDLTVSKETPEDGADQTLGVDELNFSFSGMLNVGDIQYDGVPTFASSISAADQQTGSTPSAETTDAATSGVVSNEETR